MCKLLRLRPCSAAERQEIGRIRLGKGVWNIPKEKGCVGIGDKKRQMLTR